VEASDPEGVLGVTLYWKSANQGWTPIYMSPDGSTWSTTLTGEDVVAPAIDYYFKATDAGSPAASSYLPEAADEAPFSVPVTVEGQPLPYTQHFEEISSLIELDWHAASQGPRGYGWEITPTTAASGELSVWHPRGNTEIGKLEDWLISPPLDFSTLQQIQVSWYERGTSVDATDHSLYIGIDDSDPTDGSFELVSLLPAPQEGSWERSGVYDLSAWAGNKAVYLAWFAVSENADDWYLDAVEIGPLGPDISFSMATLPETLNPGDSATLTVELANATSVAADELTISVSFPSGGASVDGSKSLNVAGNGTGSADFALSIDPTAQDNRYLPVHIEATGAESSWSYDGKLLIGEASIAVIEYQPLLEGALQVSIGVGDPDNPTWEKSLYADNLVGDLFLSEDITDHGDSLPPAAGNNRWYLRVYSEGGGIINEFSLHYDGVEYLAEIFGINAGAEQILYLPEPPELSLFSSSTQSQLAPGSSGVGVSVTVRNTGVATAGDLVATLVSVDPDLIVNGAPVSLGVLGTNQQASTGYSYTVDISPTHTDSTPVEAELQLSDGVDAWTLPVLLNVPYPNLKITDIVIDDDGGDGILDAGESATLELSVTNVGQLSCNGTVSGVLSLEASSSAVVDVDPDDDTLGTLSSGTTKDGQFDLSVDASSSPGDTVNLLLTLNDNDRSYEIQLSLVLGEPPWRSLGSLDDDVGDAIGGYEFDIVNGSYRVINGTLQLRLSSQEPFDPATTFWEAWGISIGGSYSYYQIALQSGIGSLRGYSSSSGFTDLGSAGVSYPDTTTAQLDVDLALLGLSQDSLTIGLGAGWCGEPDYYCDHFPDYWGYPYVGLYTGDWFDLEW
jgi:hypothetical protein